MIDFLRIRREEIKKLQNGNVWSEHPELTREEWRREVAEQDTQSGYWDWVLQSLWTKQEGYEE